MNTTDAAVQQSIDQIARMSRVLSSLCEDVLPHNRQMFAVMAEGPLDEMQKLVRQVEEYLAAYEVEAEPVGTNAA